MGARGVGMREGAWVLYSARYPRRSAGMTVLFLRGGDGGERGVGMREGVWVLCSARYPRRGAGMTVLFLRGGDGVDAEPCARPPFRHSCAPFRHSCAGRNPGDRPNPYAPRRSDGPPKSLSHPLFCHTRAPKLRHTRAPSPSYPHSKAPSYPRPKAPSYPRLPRVSRCDQHQSRFCAAAGWLGGGMSRAYCVGSCLRRNDGRGRRGGGWGARE